MPKTLRELFGDQFRLCKVRGDETVAVISELGQKEEYVAAAVDAAHDLGAAALVLTASSLSQPTLPPYDARGGAREVPALLAGASECDLVIDLTVGGLIHSDVRTRITGNGKRMLFVAEPEGVLERLMGNEEIRALVRDGSRRLRRGKNFRVTSDAGTSLTADISGDDLPITEQWGFVDEPGRWDHWPSGFVACYPRDRSVEGTIVLQPGDVLLPFQRYVGSVVRLEVQAGYIVRVEGDGADAVLLRDYLEAWKDPEVWATSHVGWGVHPCAHWSAFGVYDPRAIFGQELRSTSGNFMWSTGSNRFANRHTPAHLDIPMRGCTVRIDEDVVVNRGELVTGASQ